MPLSPSLLLSSDDLQSSSPLLLTSKSFARSLSKQFFCLDGNSMTNQEMRFLIENKQSLALNDFTRLVIDVDDDFEMIRSLIEAASSTKKSLREIVFFRRDDAKISSMTTSSSRSFSDLASLLPAASSIKTLRLVGLTLSVEDMKGSRHQNNNNNNNVVTSLSQIESLIIEKVKFVCCSSSTSADATTATTQRIKKRSGKPAKFSSVLSAVKTFFPTVKKLVLREINTSGKTNFSSGLPPRLEEFELIDHFSFSTKSQHHQQQQNLMNKISSLILSAKHLASVRDSLKKFSIVGANFSAPLDPSVFAQCRNLQALILSRCCFTGAITGGDWRHSFPPSLEYLDLSQNNDLTGGVDLSSMPLLRFCNLSNNNFQGSLLHLFSTNNNDESNTNNSTSSSFSSLRNLEVLDLRNNQFCFNFGECKSFPENLSVFAISGNEMIFGEVNWKLLAACWNLTKFLADRCSLQGDVDLDVLFGDNNNGKNGSSRSSKLEVLSLKGNHFDGTLKFVEASSFSSGQQRLHTLELSGNNFKSISPANCVLKTENYPSPNTLLTFNIQGSFSSSSSWTNDNNNNNKFKFPFNFLQLPRSLLRFNCSECGMFSQPKNCEPGCLSIAGLKDLPPNLRSLQMSGLSFGGGGNSSKTETAAVVMRSRKKAAAVSQSPRFFAGTLDLSSASLPSSLQILDLNSSGLSGAVIVKNLPVSLRVLKLKHNNFNESKSVIDDELALEVFSCDFFESDDDYEDVDEQHEDDEDYYQGGDEFVKYDDDDNFANDNDNDDDDYQEGGFQDIDFDDDDHEEVNPKKKANFEQLLLDAERHHSTALGLATDEAEAQLNENVLVQSMLNKANNHQNPTNKSSGAALAGASSVKRQQFGADIEDSSSKRNSIVDNLISQYNDHFYVNTSASTSFSAAETISSSVEEMTARAKVPIDELVPQKFIDLANKIMFDVTTNVESQGRNQTQNSGSSVNDDDDDDDDDDDNDSVQEDEEEGSDIGSDDWNF